MTMEISILIISILIGIYIIGTYLLNKIGIFEKYNISFYGPALLLRTKKGIGFLRRISEKKRFWKAFGNFGIAFCFIMMILMVLLLAQNLSTVLSFSPEEQASLPGLEFGLVIPGLNPILPLDYIFYIIAALIIAVIVHEFSHGILTFAQDLQVKSLGILYLIIPLGAFCEPNEEQIKKSEPKKRMRMYAAGPMSNFTVAFITILLFSGVFMAAVEPIDGVHILYAIPGSPADELKLEQGMIITSVNDVEVSNWTSFINVMENTSVNQTISITYLSDNEKLSRDVTLASKYQFTNDSKDKNISFLGIGPNLYIRGYLPALQHPLQYDFPNGLILLYSLPFFSYLIGFNPIVSPFVEEYTIQGPLSALPTSVFWTIVNLLYWIFWLNLIVAFFNVLPMIPLDGGFLFSDALRDLIAKFNKNITEEKKEQMVKNISMIISLLILVIVLSPWLVKYF